NRRFPGSSYSYRTVACILTYVSFEGDFPPPVCLSSEDSSGLFWWGFTVDRTTITLFSRSNQNGAPSEAATAVKSQPVALSAPCFQVVGLCCADQPIGNGKLLSSVLMSE